MEELNVWKEIKHKTRPTKSKQGRMEASSNHLQRPNFKGKPKGSGLNERQIHAHELSSEKPYTRAEQKTQKHKFASDEIMHFEPQTPLL